MPALRERLEAVASGGLSRPQSELTASTELPARMERPWCRGKLASGRRRLELSCKSCLPGTVAWRITEAASEDNCGRRRQHVPSIEGL
jgi:hypothetical protein